MSKAIHINRNLLAIGIPISILSLLIFIMKSTLISNNESLSIGISIDLLFTVPLVYFLLIRKTNIPKTTVVPVMLIGLLLGYSLLPLEDQTYLNLFKTWALPIIEISVITYIIIKVRKGIKNYNSIIGKSPDFFTSLKSTCSEILPKKLVTPFATEIAVFYYGFINWKKSELNENEFSYHKRSGTPALLGALIFMITIETFAIHLLLAQWSVLAAWILTGLSIYTALQVFGFVKSLSKRPITINSDSVTLKYGIMNEVEIPFSHIDHILLSKKALEKDKLTKTLSPLGSIESHNVIMYLNDEKELVGLYGIKKTFKVIAFHIDNPTDFIKMMEESMTITI